MAPGREKGIAFHHDSLDWDRFGSLSHFAGIFKHHDSGERNEMAEIHYFLCLLRTGTIEVQGEPAVTLKPGEIINLAPKRVHEAKNLLNSPTKVLVFGLAPKGEPLVVPVK
jgi:quercetin dioxygenase-like cupin family protein